MTHATFLTVLVALPAAVWLVLAVDGWLTERRRRRWTVDESTRVRLEAMRDEEGTP